MALQVVDPTGRPDPQPTGVMAPRPPSLDGKRIGLLENGKLNAGVVLDLVSQAMARQFDRPTFVPIKKPSPSKAMPDQMVEWLQKECDVVITGIGD